MSVIGCTTVQNSTTVLSGNSIKATITSAKIGKRITLTGKIQVIWGTPITPVPPDFKSITYYLEDNQDLFVIELNFTNPEKSPAGLNGKFVTVSGKLATLENLSGVKQEVLEVDSIVILATPQPR